MRKPLCTLFAVLFVAGCSAHPAFRQGEGGYEVRSTPIPEILLLEMRFPPSTPEEYRAGYLARAAGEECARRRYPYFDVGPSATGGKVFCFAAPSAPHLGVSMTMKAQPGEANELRVEETLRGASTPLSRGDVVRKISGRPVSDVADFKEQVFLARRKGEKTVTVLVERSDIPLRLQAPIYDDKSALNSPEILLELREKIP